MFLAGVFVSFFVLGSVSSFILPGWIRSLHTEMIALDRRVLFFSLVPRNVQVTL
jgi:hypothetical protein